MKIPWAIPNVQKDDLDYLKKVLESGWYTRGKVVKLFEDNLCNHVGRKYAVAVNAGTSALEVLLRAMNIGYGDEVIVPAYSYIATATAVSLVGAKPVFADVDESMTINPNEIDRLITDRTKAIMCVDLTGNPCNYDLLNEKSKKYNIPLILDGAQSLGSFYKGKSCLSYGIASTTSFHAGKILTTIEGGMVFTDDTDLIKKIKIVANEGQEDIKYIHKAIGGNFRMTDVSAAFAIKQLERFEKTLEERRRKAEHYKKLLKGYVEFLDIRKEGISCNFVFPIFLKKRDELHDFLKDNNIETRKFYPLAIPKQPAYNEQKSYPIAEKFCRETLSLPLYNSLTNEEIEYVCKKIREFFKK